MFKDEVARANTEKLLETAPPTQEQWNQDIDGIENVPRNGKRKHREMAASCDDADEDDTVVTRKKARFTRSEKVLGIFWPIWVLKLEFKGKAKPRVKQSMEHDGEKGFLLDTKHGNPSGTARIVE